MLLWHSLSETDLSVESFDHLIVVFFVFSRLSSHLIWKSGTNLVKGKLFSDRIKLSLILVIFLFNLFITLLRRNCHKVWVVNSDKIEYLVDVGFGGFLKHLIGFFDFFCNSLFYLFWKIVVLMRQERLFFKIRNTFITRWFFVLIVFENIKDVCLVQ